MKYMRVRHDFEYPDQTVPAGTILAVNEDDTSDMRFIAEGDLKYRSVHADHLEEIDVIEMNQELLQRREEVGQLMKERNMLLRSIEKEVDEQKVTLPLEVAEAIERLSESYSRRDIIRRMLNDFSYHDDIYLLRQMEFDDILLALANGYTVEEPPKEFATNRKLTHVALYLGGSELIEDLKQNG